MNPYIAEAVKQCCEYLNDTIGTPDEWLADRIIVDREVSTLGVERWIVTAWKNDKPFKYAWYVDGNNIIADGY